MIAALALALPMSALVLLWPWAGPDDYSEPVFSAGLQRLLDVSSAWPALVMATAFFVHSAARRPAGHRHHPRRAPPHPDRLPGAGRAGLTSVRAWPRCRPPGRRETSDGGRPAPGGESEGPA
ncbi:MULTISPECIES: hypothetical protein [unclassified Kitasatospora]|uniref:hypothetical protein n=1 Tax=unclassified Kitasatospora TaxID=2633591 RepID=UPI003814577D